MRQSLLLFSSDNEREGASDMLKINNLSGGYDQKIVVHNVSFQVNKGEMVGILGPNGSGKSTLLKLMSRILPAKEGEVIVNLSQCNL